MGQGGGVSYGHGGSKPMPRVPTRGKVVVGILWFLPLTAVQALDYYKVSLDLGGLSKAFVQDVLLRKYSQATD